MPASLSFKQQDKTTNATALSEVEFITLEDSTGNKYTLDITTHDLKLGYHKHGVPNTTEYTVNGLATALGKLLTIEGSTPGESVLAEEVAKKPVVDVLVPALATGADDLGVYTKKGVDDSLAGKVNVNGDNLTLPDFVTALAAGAGNNGVYTKTAADAALVGKVNVIGDNATDPGVNAMLATLKGNNQVVKISELPAKVVEKAVVDVLVPALTTGGTNDTRVYTKAAADTKFDGKVNVAGNTNSHCRTNR